MNFNFLLFRENQLGHYLINGLNQTVCSVTLNTGNTLLCFERFREFFGNVLPVFNITEKTVLVQAIYVKRVSWGSLYVSYTLGSSCSNLSKSYNHIWILAPCSFRNLFTSFCNMRFEDASKLRLGKHVLVRLKSTEPLLHLIKLQYD